MNIYYFLLIILKGVIVMEEQRTFVANRHRGRIVYVPMSFVGYLFGGGLLAENNRYINVPVIEGIPADAELVYVFPCPERDSLGLTYRHESFDEVTEGAMCPEVEIKEITFRKVRVKKAKKEASSGG